MTSNPTNFQPCTNYPYDMVGVPSSQVVYSTKSAWDAVRLGEGLHGIILFGLNSLYLNGHLSNGCVA